MSIPMNSHCIQCHLNKNLETARELGDSETATAFAHELLMVHYNAPKDASSPYLGASARKKRTPISLSWSGWIS